MEILKSWTDNPQDLVDLEYIFGLEADKEIDRITKEN